jgi:sulfur relay (sulfurtransferase) DsrC/TusE family protein
MPTTVIEGHEVSVDDEGFLTEYDQWDPEIAGARDNPAESPVGSICLFAVAEIS